MRGVACGYARGEGLDGEEAEGVDVDLLLVDDLAHVGGFAETVEDLGELLVLAERMGILIDIDQAIRTCG